MKHTYNQPTDDSTTTRAHGVDTRYPQLGLKVLLVGNCFLGGAIELFAKAGCTRADSVADAELVVFLGGEDIDPRLYGEEPIGGTYFNEKRDAREMDVFVEALASGVPMFGICRGMQFLHVMNGGKLWQDVRNHGFTHNIVDVNTKEIIRASSMHHQMCIENGDTTPLAYAETRGHGVVYESAKERVARSDHRDLEAAVYLNIGAVAVQGHPEVGGYPDYSAWCLQQVQDFLIEWDAMGGVEPDTLDPDLPFIKQGVDV